MANGVYVGNDKPNTKKGDFYLMYGKGADDKLTSTYPFDFTEIYGGSGNDKLTFSTDFFDEAFGIIDGGSGDDKINGGLFGDDLYGGKGDDTIKGNNGRDLIYGGNGDDRIKGQNGNDLIDGDKGNDKLSGNDGFNDFLFDTSLGSNNVDTITDFSVSRDLILLDNDIFNVGPAGFFLDPDQFHIGKHANSKDVRIVYNKDNGELFYTPKGNKNDTEIVFAKLDDHLNPDWGNFLVVA